MFKILIAGCIAWASLWSHVRTQELVSARVLSIEGQVEIRRAPVDQPRPQPIVFKVEDQLKAGDTIVTGKNGRLVLGLSDGSQAIIAPRTTVVIEDLGGSPRTLFNIIRGKARIHIEKLGGQPNPYRVNTPTAIIAVRGTSFDLLVEEDQTQVYLHEGEVTVTNPRTPDRPVFLVAGQMTQVLTAHLPKTPISFKFGRNDREFRSGRPDRVFKAERTDRIFQRNGQGNGRGAGGGPRSGPGGGGPPPGGSRPSNSPGKAP